MKNNANSFFIRKDLKVLSKVETKKIRGGTASTNSTANQTGSTDIVIEEIIQV